MSDACAAMQVPLSDPTGARLFAQYAFAPNELGYCGPADTATLFHLGASGRSDADITPIASSFSGVWHYLVVLAELAGIDDPMDERVVRAYWTGGPLLHQVDRRAFGTKLVDRIGSRAGHYWAHLTPELAEEATATHGFHVFGVYPWSRLLVGGRHEQPLNVLDNCRIRWGRVVARDGDHVIARSRRLTWDGHRLGLSAARRERVRVAIDGASFVADAKPGDWLALHWDWACERLDPVNVASLRYWTRWQVEATNCRLDRANEP